MSSVLNWFLNPWLLAGLPLVFLPILIHLINRQRHRTVPWGAMMFLLDAKRLQKSMAKLRYWLIMAMRMLAIFGLIVTIARPLSSGWLGSMVGSKSDTVLILLDRSPSMEQQDPLTLVSKRETALRKLSELLETTGEGKRVLLIESTALRTEEINPKQLQELPNVTPTDTESDIPGMLQSALEYLVSNEVGQADVWLASDLRENDWRSDDGRWGALREGFAEREGVRFHLLTYEQPGDENFAVSVSNVRKRDVGGSAELLLDVTVKRDSENQTARTVPLEFVVNGARSVLEIEIAKDEFTLQGHVIPIDASVPSGWGRVEIPGDSNLADNTYYFVFANESPRNIVVVSSTPDAVGPIRIAAGATPEPTIPYNAIVIPPRESTSLDWDATTLLVWTEPLPTGKVADQLNAFLAKNRPVLFFPPESPGNGELAGIRWSGWQESMPDEPIGIGSWENTSDLLGKTQSGSPLPVGKQTTQRYCKLEGVGKTLARFTNGDPLLLRADGNLPAYFFATLPQSSMSSLARDGVVLYVMVQRAIELGAKQQGNARQLDAGRIGEDLPSQWDLRSTLPDTVVSSQRSYFSASYQSGDEQWTAVNRPTTEDLTATVNDESLEKMFAGLDYHKISDDAGQSASLASEIWRVFLGLMAIALVVEAALCLG